MILRCLHPCTLGLSKARFKTRREYLVSTQSFSQMNLSMEILHDFFALKHLEGRLPHYFVHYGAQASQGFLMGWHSTEALGLFSNLWCHI